MIPFVIEPLMVLTMHTEIAKNRKKHKTTFTDAIVCNTICNTTTSTIISNVQLKTNEVLNISNRFIEDILYRSTILKFRLPDNETQLAAITINNILKSKPIDIKFINPTLEGGISFEFSNGNVFFDVEVDNERDAVLVKTSENQIPEAWDTSYNKLYELLNNLI